MLKICLGAAAALILMSVIALPAHAQDERASDVEARAQFDAGRTAYDEGHFEDAARAFRRAYLLSSRYQLLYNIGQAELRGGHDDRALEAFEGFLRQAPKADPRHSEVQERVNVLRGMGVTPAGAVTVEQPTEAPSSAASPEAAQAAEPPPAAEPSGERKIGPWIVLGAGAAGVVAGTVLMGVGASKAKDVRDAPVGSRWSELEDTGDRANLLWGVGIGIAALGLAAVGGGVAWAIAGSSDGEESTATKMSLRVGMGSFALEGAF
jgi:tetratricopeptide (TPR) repeat protein